MKVTVKKVFIPAYGYVLAPVDEVSAESIAKLKKEEFTVPLSPVRCPEFHRKYFALIKIGYENQEFYKDMNQFRRVFQMKCGYFDLVPTDKGYNLFIPKSIAYDKLNQVDFEELYNKVLNEIIKYLNLTEQELLKELGNFI